MEEIEKNGQLPEEARPIEPEQDAQGPLPTEPPAEATEPPLCEPLQEDAAKADAEQEGAEAAALPEADEQQPEQVAMAWDFDTVQNDGGAELLARNQKNDKKSFFVVFAAVLGVCLLLLFMTFWLGDEGFQIFRNVYYDRTVYVREDGTVVGTYTPGEITELVGPSTVTVSVKHTLGSSFGSGFIYRADGYICTNYHVVEGGSSVQVILASGQAYDATVVGYNAPADIAILKIEANEALTPVKLGNSNAVLVGETVVAIGTPAELEYAGTATFGKISAATRLVCFSDGNGTVTKKMRVIQTDASVNPGNSGGPLVNLDGEVIGVVAMKAGRVEDEDYESKNQTYEGIGFALPINGVKEIADQIIAKGSFTGDNPIVDGRSLLGVTGHPVVEGYWYRSKGDGTVDISPTQPTEEGFSQMSATGVHVVAVEAQSGANGRIQYGDIVTRVNGLRVSTTVELIETVNRYFSGEVLTLTVWRDGAEITVDVRLMEAPLE